MTLTEVRRPVPDLLPLIAGGDRDAVRDCVGRYGGLVWSLAKRYVGPADAEDATQAVFVDLWKSAGRFDPARADETTFVALIARRRLIDCRRRLGRVPPAGPLVDDVAMEPADAVADRDEASRAASALSQLRDEPQAVIRLAFYDGLTHDEISARTGLALGTVKTHIRRGLLRIREILDGGGR